jgi:hypothetical protein
MLLVMMELTMMVGKLAIASTNQPWTQPTDLLISIVELIVPLTKVISPMATTPGHQVVEPTMIPTISAMETIIAMKLQMSVMVMLTALLNYIVHLEKTPACTELPVTEMKTA